MTPNIPPVTTELLNRALAVPKATSAPADLHRSIAVAIRLTRQQAPPVGSRISATFGSLPRPVRLAFTALLLLAILAGIAAVGAQLLRQPGPLGDSTTFRGDVARTGVATASGPGGTMTVAFQTNLSGQIVSSAAAVDSVAYIGAIDGRFRAFDLRRRVELWSADINVAWSSPSVAGGLVIVGTEDRDLVALDRRTGDVAWRVPMDGYAAGSPAIVGDRMYVATSSEQSRGRAVPGATGKVLALDLHTHEVVWREDLPGPSTRSIAVQGSILVVPTDVGIAIAFDTATARELWRFPTQAFTDTPVIAGGKVFVSGLDPEGTRGILWAVDLESGREVWHHRRPSGQTIVAPVVDAGAGVVYAGTVDGDVVALRLADGAEVWNQHLGPEIASSPTKGGEVVYIATSGGIAALAAGSGQVLGTLPVDGIPFAPTVSDGYLIVGTQSGNLYALTAAGDGRGTSPSGSGAVASSTPSASPVSTARVSPLAVPLSEVWARRSKELGLGQPYYMNGAPDGRLWFADSTQGRFVIVAPDGSVVDSWRPTGDAALDLVQPDNDGWGAVAFLADGGILVADSDHQRILHFDATRHLIGSWGSFGSGDGQFVSPFGVSVGPDGLVYVVDDSTCRVEVFEPSGTYLRTIAGGTEFADRCTNNVVVGPDGTVFLASGGRGAPWRITAFAPDGTIVRKIGEGILREPVLLASGPNSDLYATDGAERLHLFAPDGDLRSSWSGPDVELAVIGPDGEIYMTGSDGVVRRYARP
jgi:outer membrane protein assembly factor BamB